MRLQVSMIDSDIIDSDKSEIEIRRAQALTGDRSLTVVLPKQFAIQLGIQSVLMCSNNLERLTFDDRTEEEVIKEILEYNFDETDIKHMREVERIDLYPFLNWLDENCLKRTESQWFQFGIHESIANGQTNPGTIGSMRTQFCKFCGEEIYMPMGRDAHTSKHVKRTKT